MRTNTIFVQNLHKQFVANGASVAVLRGITTRFESGRSYAITGISGSGKSTLLQLLAGFETPTEGAVFFNDAPLDLFSVPHREAYLQKTIGFLFQKPYFIKELSVLENIMLPGCIVGAAPEEASARAQELLAVVGLSAYANFKPGVLSVGQQQRICLARALYNKPAFLLADEPTAGLDTGNRAGMLELMQYGMSTWGMGLIVSTHDQVVAHAMEHVLVLADGVLQPTV
jgi:ABC-type lipoprotein export system ATPase subunit